MADKSIYNNEVLPNCFTTFRKDRDSRGGGVLIATHHSIAAQQIESPQNLEIVS